MKSISVYFLFLALFLTVNRAEASTIAFAVSPNPATYGHAVTLTATVTPNIATGTVTFYDGVTVVGVAPVTGGVAALTTYQLQSGTRSLKARYDGDSNNANVTSTVVSEVVNTFAGVGFGLSTYSVGQQPYFVALGDFNGDGKMDAVLPFGAGGTTDQLAVLLGNGDGTFQAPLIFTAGFNVFALVVGDFNGDGKADLALADAGDFGNNGPSVDILLGNGNGTFQPEMNQLTNAGVPTSIVVGDFNGDGKEDLALSNAVIDLNNDDVVVLLGNGNGTFQTPSFYATGTTYAAFGLAVGDYNLDGASDLAVAEDNLVILTGNGSGGFTLGSTSIAGTSPNDVHMGDFNNDGKPDLALVNYGDDTMDVFLGNGNGTFQPASVYAAQNGTFSVTVADFNGDGYLDIATANSFSNNANLVPNGGSVSVFLNYGNGTFQAAANTPTALGPYQIVAADLTGGGTPDLVTGDFGDGTPTNPGDLGVLIAPLCVTVSPTAPLAFDKNGGSPLFSINALNSSCSWTASTTVPSWITITTPSGSGSGQVGAIIAANSTGLDRVGAITIAGQTISVLQDFTASVFTDVTPSAYYFDAVNELSTHNITAGCGGADYCPTTPVTRDQMAIFIVRAVYNGNDNFTYSSTPHFNDVNSSTFAFQWIQKLYELGISVGCGNGDYCPTEQVTRDQMSIFIIRARYGASTVFTYPSVPYFTDVAANYFAFPWIQRLKEDAITGGCTPTAYCPVNPVTRGDMSLFVMRGGFNQLLPTGTPVISSISPTTLTHGTSGTFTLTGVNTSFGPSTTVVPTGGITASNVMVTSPTQFTVTLTAASDALLQPEPVYVQTEPQEAVLPNVLVVQ